MASKEEVIAKITAALNERAGGQKPCAVCGQIKWRIADKFAVVIVGNDPASLHLGGHSMPLIPVVCMNCGNTHLINVRILGFVDMAAIKIDDDGPAKS